MITRPSTTPSPPPWPTAPTSPASPSRREPAHPRSGTADHGAGPRPARRRCARAFLPPGPMDREAFLLANRLVGNADDAAALECTLIGPRLEFADARWVAVTGAAMPVTLNGAAMPRWAAFEVKPGDVLRLGPAASGVRAYIAVSGGIDTPPALGSRSTYLRGQLGGHRGKGPPRRATCCRSGPPSGGAPARSARPLDPRLHAEPHRARGAGTAGRSLHRARHRARSSRRRTR